MTREQIMEALQKVKEQIENNGHMVIAVILQGSQNYGLAKYTEEYMSDIDCKAFIVPSFSDMYYSRPYSTTLTTPYGLVDVKDIRLFAELIKKANPSYMELLFSDYAIIEPNTFMEMADDLVAERIPLLIKAAYGMMLQKQAVLKHPYPTIVDKIEKYGYDPKQLHHIVRLYYFMKAISDGKKFKEALHQTGDVLQFLMDLKAGKYSEEEADALTLEYIAKGKEIENANPPVDKTDPKHPVNKIHSTTLDEFERRIFATVEKMTLEAWKNKE